MSSSKLLALLPLLLLALPALVGCSQTVSSGSYPNTLPSARQASYGGASDQSVLESPVEQRKGIGTTRGEYRGSRVSDAQFTRASSSPAARIAVRYDDREGIEAATGGAQRWRARAFDVGPATLAITSGSGRALPGYRTARGNYVAGDLGDRYEILVKNSSYERIEVVVSVDGLDVMDGRGASTRKRGYIVPPRGKVTIEGFRNSSYNVEAFRFGQVADSAAANRGKKSSTRNVGVIGAAVFRERGGTQWGSERGYEAGKRRAANPFPEG